MEWESWIQGVAGDYLKTRVEAKYSQPYELEKLKMQAYGPFGDLYQEGQTLTNGAAAKTGIPPWLLIGGVVLLAVVMVRS